MKSLTEVAKNITGEVLCIGVYDKSIVNALLKNRLVGVMEIQRGPTRGIFSRKKKVKVKGKKQKVNIKKLRKSFQKKSIDYIFCNIHEIYDYMKYFYYDCSIINKKKLYLYGDSKYIDANVIAKRFERYHATCEVYEEQSKFLIIVNQEKSHVSYFKAKWLVIVDTFHNIGDMISTALIS